MKATITNIIEKPERETKFGTMYNFEIHYDDGKKGFYSCKTKEQKFFEVGKEAEFTEEEKTSEKGFVYTIIKPIRNTGLGNFAKAMSREQSKYSGFSCSYAKDLVVAGKVDIKDMLAISEKLFNHMVELDKRLKND